MPFSHHFKPSHKEIKRYYEDLAGYAAHEVEPEGATSSAFQSLLAATCKKADWHLVPQLSTKINGKTVRPDGTLRDDFNLHHGYWEAKDSSDKLDVEIRKKIALGYPLSNTIFEDTARAAVTTECAATIVSRDRINVGLIALVSAANYDGFVFAGSRLMLS